MMMNKGAIYNNQVEIRLKRHASCFQKHKNLLFCFNGLIPFAFCWCCTSYIHKRHSSNYCILKYIRFKLELICIILVGPEPVPLPRNLVIQCCHQDPNVVTHAEQEHFSKKRFFYPGCKYDFKNQLSYPVLYSNAWTC